jgi:hypothetical protein
VETSVEALSSTWAAGVGDEYAGVFSAVIAVNPPLLQLLTKKTIKKMKNTLSTIE